MRAIKVCSKIATENVFGYEPDAIPTWDDTFIEFENKEREI